MEIKSLSLIFTEFLKKALQHRKIPFDRQSRVYTLQSVKTPSKLQLPVKGICRSRQCYESKVLHITEVTRFSTLNPVHNASLEEIIDQF